jgi:hypothetical protein
MWGVPKELIKNCLKVDPKATPKKQQLRCFAPNKREAIKKELAKLLAAGFIKEHLTLARLCIYWSDHSRAQRYLSQAERGKSYLDWPCLTACFLTNLRTTFMTTQLRSSVWWLLSRSVHILSTCDNLRSKDIAYTLWCEITILELGRSILMSYMCPHY